jgi:lysophospholipase L1-like esterase
VTATLDRERPSPRSESGAQWAQVPPPIESTTPRPTTRTVVRALGGALVALVMVWIGHPAAAVAIAVAVAVITVVSWVSPGAAVAIDRAARWLGHTVGAALNFLLLGAVLLFVFTPVAAVMRLLRHDPLARGSSRTDASFWRPNPGAGLRPLWRRQFTHERVQAVSAAGLVRRRVPFLRLRSAIGLAVVVLLLDVAIGGAIDAVRDGLAKEVPATGSPGPAVAAREKEPWTSLLPQDALELADRNRPHPFRGIDSPDNFSGKVAHIRDGARVSYQSKEGNSDNAINVFFFGGSATWGLYQRDGHTIPSQFARYAEAEGIPVRVVNYGQITYAIWQEVQLLEELLAEGARPDLVVFYDGVNELNVQARVGTTAEPAHWQWAEVKRALDEVGTEPSVFRRVADWYGDRSAVAGLLRQARSLITEQELEPENAPGVWAPDHSPETGIERAREAVRIHRRAVDLVQHLAAGYGFDTLFFWQPSLYSKKVAPREGSVAGGWGERPAAWRAMTAEARRRLQPPVIDLSDALNVVDEPVMVDYSHTNELGADVVARAIFANARSHLERLSQRPRP